MKFRFRLDGLLRIRHFELRRRIALLAERRRTHEQVAARRDAESAEGVRADVGARSEIEAGGEGSRIQVFADLAGTWRRLSSRSAIEAIQAERNVARERAAMLAARTRVEALEKLRERRRERWRVEEQRRAQRELDELGTRGFRRDGGRS